MLRFRVECSRLVLGRQKRPFHIELLLPQSPQIHGEHPLRWAPHFKGWAPCRLHFPDHVQFGLLNLYVLRGGVLI